ncbi:unnamed protein product, partial [marine sediment metagenome]
MRSADYNLYWGDMHTNIHEEQVEMLEQTVEAARGYLDFLAIAYYPFTSTIKRGFRIESWGQRDRFLEQWERVREVMGAANAPGELVTFLGYEWHGNRRRYGDHNVFYLTDDGPLDASETLPELFENLRQGEAIAIPHHTAYQLGERGKDWDFHDDQLSPLAEIFSSHGSSEGCNTPVAMTRNVGMGPRAERRNDTGWPQER